MTGPLPVVLPPLRRIAIVEAVSYLILVGASVLKWTIGWSFGVSVMGPLHGVVFLVYAALLLRDHRTLGWPLWRAVTAMVVGALPLGGFWIEHNWLAPLDQS